jgi:DNA polymerase III subunit delta'
MPFRDVIGHRRIVTLLARSVAREALPPSLLFAGPAGVGKRLTALAVAQALNCLKPKPITINDHEPAWQRPTGKNAEEGHKPETDKIVDACGTCAACRRIARGVHPDVLFVEPGDNGSIKVDQVREVIDRSAYRPFEGKRRAVVIDQADALVVAAQNALLKTLEEPPPASVFMLVTAHPDLLLPTVRSRCPRLSFRPLAAQDIAAALVTRGHGEAAARAVAATAEGSLGQALEASAGDLVEARDVAQQVLAKAAAAGDPRRRLESARDLLAKTGAGGAGDREQLASHLRAMASLLRDIELLSTRADVHALANPDVQPALERLTGAFRGGRGMRAFTAVDRALVALERNAGVKIVADWLVLQL